MGLQRDGSATPVSDEFDIFAALAPSSALDAETLDDMADAVFLWDSPYTIVERMEAFMGFRRDEHGAPHALRHEDRVAIVRRFLDDYLARNPLEQQAVRKQKAARLLLRLPRRLHDEAFRCATSDGTSLNTFVVAAVAAAVALHDVNRPRMP